MTLKQLESVWYSANAALDKAQRERGERRDALIAEVEATIKSEFGERIRELNIVSNLAKDAVDVEKERIALAGNGAPYPIGTRVVEWRVGSYGWDKVLKPKRTGLIEVCTSETVFPPNRYSLPERGDFFIRVLTKDGKPGKLFERFNFADELPWGWHLEGVDPNKKTGAA